MMGRRLVPQAVRLDCGCVVTPERTEGETMESGGTLIRCPGHGLRFDVEVADVEVRIHYAARRLDPPDPEPEPHRYTVDTYLHGAEEGGPCVVRGCGQGRAATIHG